MSLSIYGQIMTKLDNIFQVAKSLILSISLFLVILKKCKFLKIVKIFCEWQQVVNFMVLLQANIFYPLVKF